MGTILGTAALFAVVVAVWRITAGLTHEADTDFRHFHRPANDNPKTRK